MISFSQECEIGKVEEVKPKMTAEWYDALAAAIISKDMQMVIVQFGTATFRDLDARRSNILVHHAIVTGELEIVRFLHGRGASMTTPDENGELPLHWACRNEDLDVLAFIISCPGVAIDAHTLNDTQQTALHIAAGCNTQLFISMLISHGADVNARDGLGNRPLHYLCNRENCRADSVNFLLKHGADVDSRCDKGCTPLYIAAVAGRLSIMQVLLRNGATPNVKPPGFLHLLVEVCKLGHSEAVHMLVRNGVHLNVFNNCHETPLHMAVKQRDRGLVHHLLTSGIDPNIGDLYKRTALHVCCQAFIDDEILDELLTCKRVDVNAVDAFGQTALFECKYHFAGRLLASGVDPKLPDSKGRTIFQLCKESSDFTMMVLLAQCGKLGPVEQCEANRLLGTLLVKQACAGNMDDVAQLICCGADVDALYKGCSALYFACARGDKKAAMGLLRMGAPFVEPHCPTTMAPRVFFQSLQVAL